MSHKETQTLANFLRSDKMFRQKNIKDSKLRKMLTGLALEFERVDGKFNDILEGYDVSKSSALLEEWESAMGIPDSCFFTEGVSVEQRMKNVITKLTALGVSTKEGFEALALTFGLTVEVWPGADVFTFPLPFPKSRRRHGFASYCAGSS